MKLDFRSDKLFGIVLGKTDKVDKQTQKEQAELVEAATMLQSQARAFLVRSAEHEKEVQLNHVYQEDIAGVPNIDDGTMRSSGKLKGLRSLSSPTSAHRILLPSHNDSNPHPPNPLPHGPPPHQPSTTWR